MKKLFKIILSFYLKILAKIAIFLHHPKIIVVAGSTNKLFTKEEIKKELDFLKINSRISPKNFNTEIGLPLSILDLPSGYNSIKNWIPALKKAPFSIIKSMPEYLILDLGVSNPGDMKYLLSIIKPNIAIITEITQRYLESFENIHTIIKEYEYLAKNTKNLFIYNHDNSKIKSLAKKVKIKTYSFGETEESDWKIDKIKKEKDGMIFNLIYNSKIKNIKLKRFGKHHIYAKTIGLIVSDYVNGNKKNK